MPDRKRLTYKKKSNKKKKKAEYIPLTEFTGSAMTAAEMTKVAEAADRAQRREADRATPESKALKQGPTRGYGSALPRTDSAASSALGASINATEGGVGGIELEMIEITTPSEERSATSSESTDEADEIVIQVESPPEASQDEQRLVDQPSSNTDVASPHPYIQGAIIFSLPPPQPEREPAPGQIMQAKEAEAMRAQGLALVRDVDNSDDSLQARIRRGMVKHIEEDLLWTLRGLVGIKGPFACGIPKPAPLVLLPEKSNASQFTFKHRGFEVTCHQEAKTVTMVSSHDQQPISVFSLNHDPIVIKRTREVGTAHELQTHQLAAQIVLIDVLEISPSDTQILQKYNKLIGMLNSAGAKFIYDPTLGCVTIIPRNSRDQSRWIVIAPERWRYYAKVHMYPQRQHVNTLEGLIKAVDYGFNRRDFRPHPINSTIDNILKRINNKYDYDVEEYVNSRGSNAYLISVYSSQSPLSQRYLYSPSSYKPEGVKHDAVVYNPRGLEQVLFSEFGFTVSLYYREINPTAPKIWVVDHELVLHQRRSHVVAQSVLSDVRSPDKWKNFIIHRLQQGDSVAFVGPDAILADLTLQVAELLKGYEDLLNHIIFKLSTQINKFDRVVNKENQAQIIHAVYDEFRSRQPFEKRKAIDEFGEANIIYMSEIPLVSECSKRAGFAAVYGNPNDETFWEQRGLSAFVPSARQVQLACEANALRSHGFQLVGDVEAGDVSANALVRRDMAENIDGKLLWFLRGGTNDNTTLGESSQPSHLILVPEESNLARLVFMYGEFKFTCDIASRAISIISIKNNQPLNVALYEPDHERVRDMWRDEGVDDNTLLSDRVAVQITLLQLLNISGAEAGLIKRYNQLIDQLNQLGCIEMYIGTFGMVIISPRDLRFATVRDFCIKPEQMTLRLQTQGHIKTLDDFEKAIKEELRPTPIETLFDWREHRSGETRKHREKVVNYFDRCHHKVTHYHVSRAVLLEVNDDSSPRMRRYVYSPNGRRPRGLASYRLVKSIAELAKEIGINRPEFGFNTRAEKLWIIDYRLIMKDITIGTDGDIQNNLCNPKNLKAFITRCLDNCDGVAVVGPDDVQELVVFHLTTLFTGDLDRLADVIIRSDGNSSAIAPSEASQTQLHETVYDSFNSRKDSNQRCSLPEFGQENVIYLGVEPACSYSREAGFSALGHNWGGNFWLHKALRPVVNWGTAIESYMHNL